MLLHAPRQPVVSLLDEVTEPDEFVNTGAHDELVELLSRRSITVGLAGHRGAGKTTRLRRTFEELKENYRSPVSSGAIAYLLKVIVGSLKFVLTLLASTVGFPLGRAYPCHRGASQEALCVHFYRLWPSQPSDRRRLRFGFVVS